MQDERWSLDLSSDLCSSIEVLPGKTDICSFSKCEVFKSIIPSLIGDHKSDEQYVTFVQYRNVIRLHNLTICSSALGNGIENMS
jgi:hypothetical protein